MKQINYCGFENIDDLIKDHKIIKTRIKEREKKIDGFLANEEYICDEGYSKLEEISQEIRSINI